MSINDTPTYQEFDNIRLNLPNLYTPIGKPIMGGMGQVFKVHHNTWNTDLAIKQPHADLYKTDEEKQIFINECEAWIDLGLHPHIVSCYYVREFGGTPSVFSEWMNGGSLKDIIDNQSLYQGNDSQIFTRILDIAIQFARGLHYAHQFGLIHQDVKPDNLMLNNDGTAKVTDFGIARARNIISTSHPIRTTGTIVSQGGGYTPPYRSPEQKNGATLTRRTDIWSWAVSVLEMLLGECCWTDGIIAGSGFEDYLPQTKISVPKTLVDLLRRCFRMEESQRPHDFSEIDNVLCSLYLEHAKIPYPRKQPKSARETADSLNNKALSYLDIGKPKKALECWKNALLLNPKHLDCVYNNALHEWRSGACSDTHHLHNLLSICKTDGSAHAYFLAGMFLMERGDDLSAIKWLEQAVQNNPDDYESLASVLHYAKKRRSAWRNKSYSPNHSSTTSFKDPHVFNQNKTNPKRDVYLSYDESRYLILSPNGLKPSDKYNRNQGTRISHSIELIGLLNRADHNKFYSLAATEDNLRTISVQFSADEKYAIILQKTSNVLSQYNKHLYIKLFDLKTLKCVSSFNSDCFDADAKEVYYTSKKDEILIGKEIVQFPQFNFFADWALSKIEPIETRLNLENKYIIIFEKIQKAMQHNDISNAISLLNDACDIPSFLETKDYYHINNELAKYCRHIKPTRLKLLDESPTKTNYNSTSPPMIKSYNEDLAVILSPQNSLLNLKTNVPVIPKLGGTVANARFSPDDRYLAAQIAYSTEASPKPPYRQVLSRLCLWDTASGEILLTINNPKGPSFGYHFTRDKKLIVIQKATELSIFSITDGSKIADFSTKHRIDNVFLSHYDKKIIMQCNDENHDDYIDIWNIATGSHELNLNKHHGRYEFLVNDRFISQKHIDFNYSGNHLMIKSINSNTRDVAIRAPSTITHSWFLKNNRYLFTKCRGGEAFVFDVITQKPAFNVIINNLKDHLINQTNLLFAWELDFPGWSDWDEEAKPYLEEFLELCHDYSEDDFALLIENLQNNALGWIRPEGIRTKLVEMKNNRR